MKSKIFYLSIFFVIFSSCTKEEVRLNEINDSVVVQTKSDTPQWFENIVLITYRKGLPLSEVESLRNYFMDVNNYTGIYSIEMHNPFPQNPYIEYWIISSFGKPGGDQLVDVIEEGSNGDIYAEVVF